MNIMHHLTPSLEGIEFQNGAFFKELVLTLGHTPREKRGSMKNDDFAWLGAELDKVIKRHVGLTTAVVWENFDMNAYVAVPFIDINSPIFITSNEYFAPGTRGADYFVSKQGTSFKINPKTSMVSGKLTEEVFHIGAPKLTYINGKMNDEELVAVILHEVGHFFTMFECLDKTVSTNAILQEMDQRLRDNPTPKEREVILEKAGKALKFQREIVEDAKQSTDDKVVLTIFVGHAVQQIRTESGQQFFDLNTWETLADQFAIRHGAGKALATGLDKMYSGSFAASAGSTAKYLMLEIFKVVRLLGVLGGGAFLITASPAAIAAVGAVVFYAVLGLALTYLFYGGSFESTPTYATAFERFIRMRQQLVEQAKRLSLTTKPLSVQKQLFQDIAALDEIMKNYHDRQSWLDNLSGFLFSSVKTQQNNVKFQKQLEALALNDLYLHSLSLKNL